MKILVYGAGVIGTTYSWLLSEVGYDVTHIVIEDQFQMIMDEGISIDCTDLRGGGKKQKSIVYRPKIVVDFSPEDGFDLIIVPVKRNHLETVLPKLSEKAGDADILFLQNNWGFTEEIDKYLEPKQYLFGFPWIVGGGRKGTKIESIIFGLNIMGTIIGEKDGQITPRVKKIAEAIEKAGLRPKVTNKVLGWLMTHYVAYIGCVGGILKAGSLNNFSNDWGLIKESILATREALNICKARGANLKDFSPMHRYFWPLFITVPVSSLQYKTKSIKKMLEDGHMTHGMDELAVQYYDVIKVGKELNIDMSTLMSYEPYYKKLLGEAKY